MRTEMKKDFKNYKDKTDTFIYTKNLFLILPINCAIKQ